MSNQPIYSKKQISDMNKEFENKINSAIKSFSKIGVQLQRSPISFSFGNREECEKMFYSALLTCDKTIKEPIRIPEHEEIIDWMVDTKGKGLLLAGVCGRGKTSILTGVIPVLFKLSYNKLLIPIQAQELGDIKGSFKEWAYCIDDIGTESINNNYGTKRELFTDIMSDAEQHLKPVFISTNLDGQKVINRYGKRTMDRIIRLCKIIKFNGDSFRE